MHARANDTRSGNDWKRCAYAVEYRSKLARQIKCFSDVKSHGTMAARTSDFGRFSCSRDTDANRAERVGRPLCRRARRLTSRRGRKALLLLLLLVFWTTRQRSSRVQPNRENGICPSVAHDFRYLR